MYKDNVPGLNFLIIRDLFSMLTNKRTPCSDLHRHGMISSLFGEHLNNRSIPLFIFTIINIVDIINSTKGSFQLSL
jgi:hypothetical protein